MEVFRSGQPSILDGDDLATDAVAVALGTRSVCHLPLISRDRVLGIFESGQPAGARLLA